MTKENQIDFIAAHNGGIQLFSNNGIVGFAKTADALAYMLKTKGFGDVFHSSSMEIACWIRRRGGTIFKCALFWRQQIR